MLRTPNLSLNGAERLPAFLAEDGGELVTGQDPALAQDLQLDADGRKEHGRQAEQDLHRITGGRGADGVEEPDGGVAHVAEDEGGGICVDDERSTDVNNVTILYNSSVHDNTAKTGGGIYVVSNYVYLVGSTVTNNTATGKNGGGVYVDSMDDIEVAEAVVIRDNTANGEKNNLCLQNGVFSSAKIYSGGLEDGAYIGISTTGSGSATVGKNISLYQVNKYLHADDYARSLSMTNLREVSTPLFASVISDNISLIIIIGGVIIIAGIVLILYFKKRRKEGRKDEANDDEADTNADEENE